MTMAMLFLIGFVSKLLTMYVALQMQHQQLADETTFLKKVHEDEGSTDFKAKVPNEVKAGYSQLKRLVSKYSRYVIADVFVELLKSVTMNLRKLILPIARTSRISKKVVLVPAYKK